MLSQSPLDSEILKARIFIIRVQSKVNVYVMTVSIGDRWDTGKMGTQVICAQGCLMEACFVNRFQRSGELAKFLGPQEFISRPLEASITCNIIQSRV